MTADRRVVACSAAVRRRSFSVMLGKECVVETMPAEGDLPASSQPDKGMKEMAPTVFGEKSDQRNHADHPLRVEKTEKLCFQTNPM